MTREHPIKLPKTETKKQTTISLPRTEFDKLLSYKTKVEKALGASLSWVNFLLGIFSGGAITSIILDIIEAEEKNK